MAMLSWVKRYRWIFAPLMLLLFILTACTAIQPVAPASSAPPPTPVVEAAPPALPAGNWIVAHYDDGQGNLATATTKPPITAAIDGSFISGFSGCSGYTATYEVTGENGFKIASLALHPTTSPSSECEGGSLAVQEAAYLAALQSAVAYESSADQLTLLGKDGQPVVIYTSGAEGVSTPTPAPIVVTSSGGTEMLQALVDVKWHLQTIVDPDNGEVAVEQPENYSVVFHPDFTVTMMTKCDEGRGRYRVDGDKIEMEIVASHAPRCEPGCLDDQFVSALNSAASFNVEGGVLTITEKFDSGSMTFAPGG